MKALSSSSKINDMFYLFFNCLAHNLAAGHRVMQEFSSDMYIKMTFIVFIFRFHCPLTSDKMSIGKESDITVTLKTQVSFGNILTNKDDEH
jgi:hypothetical protein